MLGSFIVADSVFERMYLRVLPARLPRFTVDDNLSREVKLKIIMRLAFCSVSPHNVSIVCLFGFLLSTSRTMYDM